MIQQLGMALEHDQVNNPIGIEGKFIDESNTGTWRDTLKDAVVKYIKYIKQKE